MKAPTENNDFDVTDEFLVQMIGGGRNIAPSQGPYKNYNHATLASCLAAFGALQSLAVLPIKHNNISDVDTHNVDDYVNDDHILFAALLTCRTVRMMTGEGQIIKSGPKIFKEAMLDFKKLTGRDPEEFLDDNFIQVANSPPEETRTEVIDASGQHGKHLN